MYNTSFFKKILLISTVVLLYSCDKDFNAIGDDLIGDDHFGLESEKYDVVAYNQEATSIQSNALGLNALGIYDNPVLGTTTANYATQVALAAYAPSIGAEPVIESVVLSVPYFSHVTATNTDGSSTYALDSIYGAPEGKLKLSVYESGVQMRASYFDNTNSQVAQLYYTNQNPFFDTNKKIDATTSKPLNDDPSPLQNEQFFFDAKQITEVTKDADGKDVTTRTAPEMHLNLNKAFFQKKILDVAAAKLATADVFQEYFRGLYFQVEKSGASPSNMALMDFSKGKITIKYKAKTDITTDLETVKEDRSLVINLTGSTAGLLNDVKNSEYVSALQSRDSILGDERLYLKGGQGSLAVIEPFGVTDLIGYNKNNVLVNKPNGVPDALDEVRLNVRTKKWLANEANLVFYIDAAKMTGADEPRRVYLYDLNNNIPIVDYASDGSTSVTTDPKMSKVIYGGIITADASTKRGSYYKFRLTSHIRNIIKDTTAKNVKLGLVVSEDISITASNKLELKNKVISEAPRASVMNPLGTILFGSKANVPDDKKLQLEVYYTKPN